MSKFHVNYEGVAGKCRATRHCPFGDIKEDHYATAGEARAAYEAKMSEFVLADPLVTVDESVQEQDYIRPRTLVPAIRVRHELDTVDTFYSELQPGDTLPDGREILDVDNRKNSPYIYFQLANGLQERFVKKEPAFTRQELRTVRIGVQEHEFAKREYLYEEAALNNLPRKISLAERMDRKGVASLVNEYVKAYDEQVERDRAAGANMPYYVAAQNFRSRLDYAYGSTIDQFVFLNPWQLLAGDKGDKPNVRGAKQVMKLLAFPNARPEQLTPEAKAFLEKLATRGNKKAQELVSKQAD